MQDFSIDPDIRRASTLPGRFYNDAAVHQAVLDRVFARSWQLVADADSVRSAGQVLPITLLPGSLDEPLLLTRDADGRLHGLSNVCTHRGNLLVEEPGLHKSLICRYHGRRFGLDGAFRSMPECEDALDFPGPADSLPRLSAETWERFVFCSLDPAVPFGDLIAPMRDRLRGLPFDRLAVRPEWGREYLVGANWALYCDNYLEGFHIPYVHAGLNESLDYSRYRTELFDVVSLQVGIARDAEAAFEPAAGPADPGGGAERVAAYYFFLFPNTMFNVYPWGISINVVEPLGVDRTRVRYLTYVWDKTKVGTGAGADLDKVEKEDEAVVEAVQRGTRSRLYDRGRYSPSRERAVHHFHRLLAEHLAR